MSIKTRMSALIVSVLLLTACQSSGSLANTSEAGTNRIAVYSHTEQGGTLVRVTAIFVGSGGAWEEWQHGVKLFDFEQVFRSRSLLLLFDPSRNLWLRLEYPAGADCARGWFGEGGRSNLPASWSPLDASSASTAECP